MQLAASRGNTPFDILFLMLSFFIIAAALLLVALLFRLGFEQRASSGRTAAGPRLESTTAASLATDRIAGHGTCSAAWLGLCLGLGYAALMLAGVAEQVLVAGRNQHTFS